MKRTAFGLLFFNILLTLSAGSNKITDVKDLLPNKEMIPERNMRTCADSPEEKSAVIKDSKISEAMGFCKNQKLETTLAFFVDMSIHSGKKRFFIYDFNLKKIIHSGLCCHGMGMGSSCETPVFSNAKGSNCTSLGKYKTGARSYSNWGINIHYKMHGLEATNSNAFNRIVVLHSYDYVPEAEIFPDHLPMGWSLGCPVISNQMMTKIDALLKNRSKPVLLWIYK